MTALDKAQARRWAELEAKAAAATAVVDALTERLEEEIYLRSAAESAAGHAEVNPHWGHVYWPTEDEPDAVALLDLSDGRVLLKRDDYWIDAASEKQNSMRYVWPLDGGPYMAWDYEYHFSAVVRDLATYREQDQRIREIVRSETSEYGPLMEQPLDAVVRLARNAQAKQRDQYAITQDLRERLWAAERTAP